ncbi:MAG: hypothetical protein ACE5PM_02310 [Candidatus Hydrothermarchaeales archaeon]
MVEIIRGEITDFIEGDDYKVMANVGAIDGVKAGMPFMIYSEGDEIFDIETKESLGRLEFVKAKVRVAQVAERSCILESDEYASEFSLTDMSRRGGDFTPKRVQLTLELDRGRKGLSAEDRFQVIQIGDPVRYDIKRE